MPQRSPGEIPGVPCEAAFPTKPPAGRLSACLFVWQARERPRRVPHPARLESSAYDRLACWAYAVCAVKPLWPVSGRGCQRWQPAHSSKAADANPLHDAVLQQRLADRLKRSLRGCRRNGRERWNGVYSHPKNRSTGVIGRVVVWIRSISTTYGGRRGWASPLVGLKSRRSSGVYVSFRESLIFVGVNFQKSEAIFRVMGSPVSVWTAR
jgi:hypothetical protein